MTELDAHPPGSRPGRRELRRYRRHLARELDHIARYRALAERAEGERREILLQLAAAEERHAAYWSSRLRALGVDSPVPERHRPSRTTRLLALAGRRLGVSTVVPLLERLEAAERVRYDVEPDVAAQMAADERVHAQLVARLAPAWRTRASGSLRAAVFGVNDGLVSNLALVAGMAGGGAAADTILLAGVAGLVAGAGSMAAGEYISVRSQRELLDAVAHLSPETLADVGDVAELELLLRLRGLDPAMVTDLAARLPSDPQAMAEALREGGGDSDAVGGPLPAAASSFVAFAGGAALPVSPFLAGAGGAALAVAVVLAGAALLTVGALLSVLTHRPLGFTALRQLAIGAAAAAGTYVVGSLVGTALG